MYKCEGVLNGGGPRSKRKRKEGKPSEKGGRESSCIEGNNWHILIIRGARTAPPIKRCLVTVKSNQLKSTLHRARSGCLHTSRIKEEAVIVNYCRSKLHIPMDSAPGEI